MSKLAWQPYCENCSWAGEKYTVPGESTTVFEMSKKALQELSTHLKTATCLVDKDGSWGVAMTLVSGAQTANKKPKPEVQPTSHLKVTEEPNGGNTRKTKHHKEV